MTDNISYLVPPGKIRCFITGKLRKDTPEENVRQRWARSLVEEYGYPKEDVGVEVMVRIGRARKRTDIAVYTHDAAHRQENIVIAIEVKRDDTLPSDDKGGDGQLISYMAACPACRFGLWVGSERRAYERLEGGVDRVTDIPRFGADRPKRPLRDDLVQTHELKSVFRRCHNYIYANAGLQKAPAFHELLKLIFCKTFDEEESGDDLQFGVDPQERRSTSGQRRLMEERIGPLFRRVTDRYPFIFGDDDQIKLEERVVAYVVSEIQFLSLLDTETDVKGAAYEELVGANLRGDRGEYFTPRNVCDMAVRMAMSLFDQTKLTSLKVLDCCCGTGGFLVSWLNNLHSLLLEQERSRPQRKGSPEERARRRVHDVCTRNLYGLDINPDLVRTCQMNLVLHGDGSSNIYRVDSTRTPGEWDGEAHRAVPYGAVDILFTNPPFGGDGKIDDGHVLDRYELPKWETKAPRSSMPAEHLFVETALGFVKPEGYLVILVPDSIVNNPGLRFIRSWLLRRTQIVASVGLPKTTFAASKGIKNPSILIVRRLSPNGARQADAGFLQDPYNVFMSTPRTSGIDNQAKPVYRRQPNGQEMVDENGDKIRDDQIGGVVEKFHEWLGGESSI